MKIGIAYLEYSRRKGIERISAELADRAAQQGNEVHYHCARWSDESTSKVHFHKVPTLDVFFSSKLISFAVAGKLSLHRGHYDVTHSYGTVIGCDVITAQSCHRAGMDIAAAFMKDSVGSTVNFGVADRLRLYLERQNFGKRKYKKVVACSSLVKRELMKYYGVPEHDIVVIPNGVDVKEFHPGNRERFRDEIRQVYGIKREDIVLLFIGHEFARKGLETIVRSLPLLNDNRIKLLVCGGDRAEQFRRLAVSLKLDQQVIFAGPQADVKKFYAASDLFVFPTVHEAFGLVIVEAMASGLPVVVSKNAGAAEDIIDDGKDGILLTDPMNAKEVAEKIESILRNDILRKNIGIQARKKVQSLDWDRIGERVIRVYEEIA
jgi:UDP-glucose:(heptosyl)LPS alpha-1,3-glucosyltransferase